MSEPGKTEKREAAETVDDAELDRVQGGGLMNTPVGGWGVAGSAEPNAGAATDPRKTRFASTAGGSPNV